MERNSNKIIILIFILPIQISLTAQSDTVANFTVQKSNFDWQYYCQKNNLHFSNTEEALYHYQHEGFFKRLDYCKSFNIAILFNLEDINKIDPWIDQLNHFMKMNPQNRYWLKINIPIDSIQNKSYIQQEYHTYLSSNSILNYSYEEFCRNYIPSVNRTCLINSQNYTQYSQLALYIKNGINIDPEKVQIYFSSDRGNSMGGFLFLTDQLIQQKIPHDYIIKLQTDSTDESNQTPSFLSIPINMLLREPACLCSRSVLYEFYNQHVANNERQLICSLLSDLKLPIKNFNYPEKSVFIASSKLTQYIKKYNISILFNRLKMKKDSTQCTDQDLENSFEKLLGYIIDYVGSKQYNIDHFPRMYEQDNTLAQTTILNKNYDLVHRNLSLDFLRDEIINNNIRIMAIYFPQFHEVEENNRFWGKGFTEWTMLRHYAGEIKHPHVDIGYYDMLDYNVRKKQAMLAKEHGISAFCYYHYWFKDKKVMYKGVEKILQDGEPNIPFAFCWANEPWTKNWDGSTREILIPQNYGTTDDWHKHYRYLAQFFKHPNYIKEDNCPVFYVYRIGHIIDNNAIEMFSLWKNLAKKDGFNGMKIIAILCAYKNITSISPNYIDGLAEHQPGYNVMIPGYKMSISKTNVDVDRENFYQNILYNKKIGNNYTRGIFYSFDNSSRKNNGERWKYFNLSYQSFENFLVKTIEKIIEAPNCGNNFILLNSWNEWTEQAMVEPNDQDGYALLNIIKKYFANTACQELCL